MRDAFEQLCRIEQAIAKIMQYAKKGRRRFDREETIRLSMVYYLRAIEQALDAIPEVFRNHHAEIPWEQMAGIQNYLTPYSIEIDRDALWIMVDHDLPSLKLKIDAALAQKDGTVEDNKSLGSIVREKNTTAAVRELLRANREDILRIAAKYGASDVRIFGSVARGEADAESDIDLLVDIEPGRTLFDLSELLMDLQDLLGREVDILTEKGLHDRIRERILRDVVPL